jgi:hypothetical protein
MRLLRFCPSLSPERFGFVGEGEKRGVKSIVGMVFVAQNGPADAVDKGPAPLYQRGKGQFTRLAHPCREPLQQLAIGQRADCADIEEHA